MSRHHRTHKRGWARIRQRAIRAAARRCSTCGHAGKLEVHHPIPLARGGTHDQLLLVVCRACHLASHHQPEPARVAWARFLVEEFSPC